MTLKGVYVLLFKVTEDFSRRVGSLGRVRFERGEYAYVGSARSSLFPRLERHYSKRKRLHWHVDYLTSSKYVAVEKAIYSSVDSKEIECRLCAKLSILPFSRAIPSFGSSDCRRGCRSHLYMVGTHAESMILQVFKNEGLTAFHYPE